jgi:flagellar motor switch protein FliN/FliY
MTHPSDDLGLLLDVPVHVTVELGRRSLPIGEVVQLGPGAIVELGKAAGESLDILVNGKLVARGEAVVVGEKYGVRITEVMSQRLVGQGPAANEAPAGRKEKGHAA